MGKVNNQNIKWEKGGGEEEEEDGDEDMLEG